MQGSLSKVLIALRLLQDLCGTNDILLQQFLTALLVAKLRLPAMHFTHNTSTTETIGLAILVYVSTLPGSDVPILLPLIPTSGDHLGWSEDSKRLARLVYQLCSDQLKDG